MVWVRTFSRLTPRLSSTPAAMPFALAHQPQQQMLGADVVMVEAPRLIHRQLDHLLGARGQPDLAQDDAVAAADDELDGAAHFVELDAQVGQHLGRHPVALAHQSQQQVLGPNVVVVEALRFFLRQAQHFARSLRKLLELIVHLLPPFHGRKWPAAIGKICFNDTPELRLASRIATRRNPQLKRVSSHMVR